MELRAKFGALLGAGGLILLTASAVVADPPTYTIDVTKNAVPPTVPIGGGNVTYSISVDNTGTGSFIQVVVDDGMAGCTLGLPTGDDGDGTLEDTETWVYSCTVLDVDPDTMNTATVDACHNNSGACSQNPQRVHDTASFTVLEGEAPPPTAQPTAAPTAPPTTAPTGSPGASPTLDAGGATSAASPPATDANFTGPGVRGPANTILLVLALGMLLASVILITPAKAVRKR